MRAVCVRHVSRCWMQGGGGAWPPAELPWVNYGPSSRKAELSDAVGLRHPIRAASGRVGQCLTDVGNRWCSPTFPFSAIVLIFFFFCNTQGSGPCESIDEPASKGKCWQAWVCVGAPHPPLFEDEGQIGGETLQFPVVASCSTGMLCNIFRDARLRPKCDGRTRTRRPAEAKLARRFVWRTNAQRT